MRSVIIALLLGPAIVTGSCNPAHVLRNEQLDPGFPPQPIATYLTSQDVITEREQLTQWLDRGPASGFFPTIGVAVVVNSQPVYIHYVNSDPQKSYGMASITKIFTGLSIMQLVDAGRIDLDKPVHYYLPGLHLKRESLPAEPVRVRHLVSHLGGLPDLRYYHSDWLKKSENNLPFRIPRPIYPPGQHYRYSNQGFMILGKIIEAVSGMPLKQYYQEHIFDPLDMQGAHVRPRYSGAFGLRLTLPDIIKFASFWMRGGLNHRGERLLARKTLHRMMQPPYHFPSGTNFDYCGIAWRVKRDAKGVHQFFHIGGANGIMVWLQIFPRMNAAVMYLANPPEMKDEIMGRIPYLQYRLGRFAGKIVKARQMPSEFKVSKADPERDQFLTGRYISPMTSRQITIDLEQPEETPEATKQALLKWNHGLTEGLNPGSTRHYFGLRTGIKYDFVYVPSKERPLAIATVDDYFVKE